MKHSMYLIHAAFFCLVLAACTSVSNPEIPPVSPSALPIKTGIAHPMPSATPVEKPTPTFATLILSNPRIIVLAENLPGPDDLLLAPDGSIYLSDVTEGTIRRYTPDTGLQVYISGLSEPEGMVILSDGSLIVAEQGQNRLVRYDPNKKTLVPFLILQNRTNQLGVDGLALDAHIPSVPTIIVPDSPNGTVLRVSPDGKTVAEIPRSFARPTGTWVEADGSILVVEENGNSLDRIRSDGMVEKLASLPIPDDVIEDSNGDIFVNTMGDGAIHLISSATKQSTVLVDGLSDPQGLTFDREGNLIVADAGHHRLIKIIIH